MKTYPKLLLQLELLVNSGKVSLEKLNMTEIEFEKILTRQKIPTVSQISNFYAQSGLSKDKTPTKSEIGEVIAEEIDRQMSLKKAFAAQIAAKKALTDKDLLATIMEADLANSNKLFGPDAEANLAIAEAILEARADKALDDQISVVFQGGGAKGAFQAGAMVFLGKYWDKVNVKHVIGSSTGSFSALQMAAYGKEAGERLAAHYSTMEEADFNDWSAKYSEVTRILSKSYFPKKLDEFLQGLMQNYPNRFNAKAIQYQVTAQPHITAAQPPEVDVELLNDNPQDLPGLIPGISSETLMDYADYISEVVNGLSILNLIPYGNVFFSAAGFIFADEIEEFAKKVIAIYEGVEKLEGDGLGLMNSEKIFQTIQIATRAMRENMNDIELHAAVTSVADTRLLWVDKKGNFGRDFPHDPNPRPLPEEHFEKGILASMAFPIMFDPIKIANPKGEIHLYNDGGIRENCGIAKAYEQEGRKVWVINCSPSPLKSWPDGPQGEDVRMAPYMGTILMDIFSHENDLAERNPRIQFPLTKTVTQVSPGRLLIGLLEPDRGCVHATMLSGFLHTQVELYDQILGIDNNRRTSLRVKIIKIENQLREMLLIERGMFSRQPAIAKTSHIIQNNTIGVRHENVDLPPVNEDLKYYFCFTQVENLREAKKKLAKSLKEYCMLFNEITGEKQILPDKLGHLTLEDLLVNISYPLGNAMMHANPVSGSCYEYVYKPGTPVNNQPTMYLSREQGSIRYSNLWGNIVREDTHEELVAGDEAPDLEVFRFHLFVQEFRGTIPQKPLVHKKIDGPVYAKTKSKVNQNFTGYDKVLQLSKGVSNLVLAYGQDGRFALYPFDKNTSRITENPIANGQWQNINSTDHQIIHLLGSKYLVYEPANGAWRIYSVNFANLQGGDIFNQNTLHSSGTFAQLGHNLTNKIVFKHPEESQLVFIDPSSGQFQVHAFQLTDNDPFLKRDSRLFSGDFNQPVNENDTFQVLNKKILVQKSCTGPNTAYQFKFFHLEIDSTYKSLVHFKPLYVSPWQSKFDKLIEMCPLGDEWVFRLHVNMYEVKDSVYRFAI